MRLQMNPLSDLVYKIWDDEVVLYDDASGHTHLVDVSVLVIIEALQKEPQDFSTLVAMLMDQFDDANELEASDYLQKIVSQLQDIGLIERIHT